MALGCPMCGKDKAADSDRCACGYGFSGAGKDAADSVGSVGAAVEGGAGDPPAAPRKSAIAFWGWVLVACGLFGVFRAYTADVSVGIDMPGAGDTPYLKGLTEPYRVANLELQQKRLMGFLFGLSLFVSGAIFIAAGVVEKALRRTPDGRGLPPETATVRSALPR